MRSRPARASSWATSLPAPTTAGSREGIGRPAVGGRVGPRRSAPRRRRRVGGRATRRRQAAGSSSHARAVPGGAAATDSRLCPRSNSPSTRPVPADRPAGPGVAARLGGGHPARVADGDVEAPGAWLDGRSVSCQRRRRRCTVEAVATSMETAVLVEAWWEHHRWRRDVAGSHVGDGDVVACRQAAVTAHHARQIRQRQRTPHEVAHEVRRDEPESTGELVAGQDRPSRASTAACRASMSTTSSSYVRRTSTKRLGGMSLLWRSTVHSGGSGDSFRLLRLLHPRTVGGYAVASRGHESRRPA